MLTVYGIASCDKCRQARRFLASRGIEHRFHDLREDGLDIQMLERWAARIDWTRLLNRQSLTWRRIPEVDRADMSKSRAFAVMIEQPTLVKRPVLECPEYLAVGFSETRFADFLTKMA